MNIQDNYDKNMAIKIFTFSISFIYLEKMLGNKYCSYELRFESTYV